MPEYAHLPYVAEPGSKKKLSKRHIEKYLNNKDFKRLYQSGANIAERIGIAPDPATFNPVLVDFYRDIGFNPAAINNYLLLLGWALDDKTESFSREQMIELFSLDRVVKAPASFDAKKLTAFQQNYMDATESKTKVASCLKFLQAADLVATPAPCDIADYVGEIVAAAGDRICMAGDILAFDFFFVDDDKMDIEDKPFQKRVVKPESAGFLLNEFKKLLVGTDESVFTVPALEASLDGFCEAQSIGMGDVIHALRVGVSGKAAGFGTIDTMAILGKQRCINRLDLTLAKLEDARNDAS